ncbi:hypothetical protein [Christiangramia echinicola]|uniref:Uncharacterized protein n=1 Tax=Christiangramia echinicola TaxID=279359 RepID=A0A1H1KSK3_9FLAO|nr:hypothetical protein [Christiangramia echinicola]SDR65226.1 hypothetical protein SAMN04488552_0084 [Christiangramia echinicola]
MKTNRPKYSHKSGFKVPEDYFGKLEDKMLDNFNMQESVELKSTGSGFKVPDGYFDTLEETITSRTKQQKPRVISLFKKEYIFYAAAVITLFALLLGDFFKSGSNQNIGWDDIELSAMENYIDEGYEMGYIDLNSSEYSDFILNGGQLVQEEDFNSVNSDAVFEYIDENLEDPAFILE